MTVVTELVGPADISPSIDCLLGLAMVVSVAFAAWVIYRNRK